MNSSSSNDSIVFVFMGQSHTRESMEKLKKYTSKQKGYKVHESDDNILSQNHDNDNDMSYRDSDNKMSEESMDSHVLQKYLDYSFLQIYHGYLNQSLLIILDCRYLFPQKLLDCPHHHV
jgi:hypothetical protein